MSHFSPEEPLQYNHPQSESSIPSIAINLGDDICEREKWVSMSISRGQNKPLTFTMGVLIIRDFFP
jgi:hypothetical protein